MAASDPIQSVIDSLIASLSNLTSSFSAPLGAIDAYLNQLAGQVSTFNSSVALIATEMTNFSGGLATLTTSLGTNSSNSSNTNFTSLEAAINGLSATILTNGPTTKVNNTSQNSGPKSGNKDTLTDSIDKFIVNFNAKLDTAKVSISVFANMLYSASNSASTSGTMIGTAGVFVATKLREFVGPLANVAASMGTLANSVSGIGAGFAAVGSSISSLFSGLSSGAGTVIKFVEAFNPALVEQFNIIMKDLTAVIGAGLQPVLTAFSLLLRSTADALVPIVVKLTPAFQALGNMLISFLAPIINALVVVMSALVPIINQLAPIFEQIAEVVGDFLGNAIIALVPTLEMLGELFVGLANVLLPVIQLITNLLESTLPYLEGVFVALGTYLLASAIPAIIAFVASIISAAITLAVAFAPVFLIVGALTALYYAIKLVAGFFGFGKKEDAENRGLKPTGASVGAAARQAQYTSVEDLSKNLIKSAFSGSGNDPLTKIADNGKKQLEVLERIAGKKPAPVQVNLQGPRQPGAVV